MISFAALQTRLNDAQVKHLADKTFSINAADVDGLFSAAYVDPFGVESNSPAFTCKESDVPEINHNDYAVEGMNIYKIRNIKPDGEGMVTLILELQNG